jgi:hypothetical protein
MQKIIDDDSYEILELNVSEPIIFEANKYEQPMYNEKNNQVMLIVPVEKVMQEVDTKANGMELRIGLVLLVFPAQ